MAAPDAPASITARPGPHPQSLYVNFGAVTATPTVDYYTVYVDGVTGVGKAQYRHKQVSTDVDVFLDGLPFQGPYFINATATNADDESDDGTEYQTVWAGA